MKHNTMSKRLRCTTAALAAMSLVALLASCGDEDDEYITKTVEVPGYSTASYTDYSGTSYDIDVVQVYDIDEDGYVSTSALTISGLTVTLPTSWGDATEVSNNDASSTWWSDNSATSSTSSLSGDFAVRYTWDNTTEPDDSSVVIQLTDGTNYWDWTIGEATSGGWGTLYTSVDETAGCFTGDGEAAPWVYRTSDTGEFGGTYETLIVRTGSTLVVHVSIYHTAGGYQVSSYTIVQTGFSEEELTACLTGNTYYISNIYYSTGSADVTGSVSIEESEDDEEETESDYPYTESISVGGTTYTLSWGDETSFGDGSIYDTSYSWWNNGTGSGLTATSLSSGDFAIRYTWENADDVNYSDVVVELYDSTPYYWDWTLASLDSDGNLDAWGNLQSDTNTTFSYTEDGSSATWVAPGGSDSDFEGYYELVIVRVGTTLVVQATINRASGEVAVYTVTQTSFTTEALSSTLMGNIYFIDDITVATGTLSSE